MVSQFNHDNAQCDLITHSLQTGLVSLHFLRLDKKIQKKIE